MSFMDIPLWIRGCMGVWILAAFFLSLGMLMMNYDRRPVRYCVTVSVMLFLYFSFQCVSNINDDVAIPEAVKSVVMYFGGVPVWIIVFLLFAVSFWELWSFYDQHRWKERHLTNSSIRDAVDTLPVGVCCYEDSGHIILQNKTMDSICRRFTGGALLNGRDFAERVSEKAIRVEKRPILENEGQFFVFEEYEILQKGRNLWILTASDITEEYRKTDELETKKKDVLLLNEKLRSYNKEISSVITQKEILHAKIQVHDVMGSALLSAKRYITGGASEELKEEIIRGLTQGVGYLLTESAAADKDSYQKIFETARKLDADIFVDGNLPMDERNKTVISAAMHECLTNTLRHAGGDTLYVSVQEGETGITAVFTNNGSTPAAPIEEQGGLASLRSLTEQAGGRMNISVDREFCLTIILPKEDIADGI